MKIYRIGLLLTAIFALSLASVEAAPNSIRVDSLSETPSSEKVQATPVEKPQEKLLEKAHELHRLDFRIEGKSCPVCLLSIQNKLKSLNGVHDAAVMLKRPFGASVIYQSEKASSDYILMMLRAKDPSIKVVEVKDSKVEKMPEPLIPPFMPAVEPVSPVPDNTAKPISEVQQ